MWEGQGAGSQEGKAPMPGSPKGGHCAERCQHGSCLSAELILQRCDLELETNGHDHHTADLCQDRLVVRRGQPFRLTLHFEGRGYEASVDRLTFSAVTGGYLTPRLCHRFAVPW